MTPRKKQLAAEYGEHKARIGSRQADASREGRDIGDIPEPENPKRRAKCRKNFRAFCETYLKASFGKPWSRDHIEVLGKVEKTALKGGRRAIAMPRGTGKTTICEAATLWVMVYAHRRFPVVVGSDAGSAEEIIDSIKIEIETNDLLAEDFPEVCYPIRRLEGITQRAKGQHQGGELTRIAWTSDEIVLPTVRDHRGQLAATSGVTMRAVGITGRIRGMKHKGADGVGYRPDYVLIDDPQTDESARSPSQCKTRERVISGAILGLAGPGEKIAAIMPTTVIAKGDMADRLLDPDLHPGWQGVRKKMLNSMPTNEELWAKYDEIRQDSLRRSGSIEDATAFYVENRKAMDAGAEASWPERFEDGEISAIQHGMNKKLDDEYAFFAEYQNDPLDPDAADEVELPTAREVLARHQAGSKRVVPAWATTLTSFIDVQGNSLWWMTCAWGEGFRGAILDYSAYPRQSTRHYTLRELRTTLRKAYPDAGPEGVIRAGLEGVEAEAMARLWPTETGGEMGIDRVAIDSGWGFSTETVYEYARQSAYRSKLLPSKGEGVTASAVPISERRKKPGERVGVHWWITTAQSAGVRRLIYDTNYWKSFVMARLRTSIGDAGSIEILGGTIGDHELLADHLAAETFTRTSGRGRTVDVWKAKAAGRDNHFLDCLVGCAVQASVEGIALPNERAKGAAPKKRRKVSLSQRKAERLGASA